VVFNSPLGINTPFHAPGTYRTGVAENASAKILLEQDGIGAVHIPVT
jgi:hypothetical protein